MRMPVGGVDHTEGNHGCGLLNIIGVLNTVNNGGLINTQTPHLVGFHDRRRGAELSVTMRGGKKRVAIRGHNGLSSL